MTEARVIPQFSLTQLWQLETDVKKPFRVLQLATCPICNKPVENRFDDPNGIGLRCSRCIQNNIWPFILGQNIRITDNQKDKEIIEFELLVDNKWYYGKSDARNPWATITVNRGSEDQLVAVALNNKMISQMIKMATEHPQ